ncbi:MAG: enhanced intracellular survival protein Eis [Phycisphaerales bacterium]
MTTAESWHYGPATEADLPALARILHFCFTAPIDPTYPWLRFLGVDCLRVVRPSSPRTASATSAAPEPIATLGQVPMGQFFGGRSVPMVGVAGVGTAPEARGRGAARILMESFIREAAAEGWPLAGLYASTQAFYRQTGFEQGGHCFQISIPIRELAAVGRGGGGGGGGGVGAAAESKRLVVRQIPEWSKPEHRWLVPDDVRAVYQSFASRYDGPLDRGPYCWSRIRQMREDHFEGFGVYAPPPAGGALEGYVYFTQVRNPASGKHDLQLSDLAFATPRAAYRLAAFLGDMATMGEHILIRQAGPIHPLLTLMPLQHYTVTRREYWMTRITHLPKAIEARGWPAGLRTSLALDIADALVPANHGAWLLSIADGRGTLARRAAGASTVPTLHCDIRGLVPLYTGLYSARQAAAIGLVEGDAAAIDSAGAIFPGSSPWMSDFF